MPGEIQNVSAIVNVKENGKGNVKKTTAAQTLGPTFM
jgi:hypothetical protein